MRTDHIDVLHLGSARYGSALAPGMSTALLGTTNPDNVTRAIEAVANGPLPDDVLAHIADRWDAVGAGWDSRR